MNFSENVVQIKWKSVDKIEKKFNVGFWSHAEDFFNRIKDLRKKSGIYAMRTY